MNTLKVHGQARAVRAALDGVVAVDLDEPIRVVADAGDTSEARFARRLGEFVADPDSDTTDTEHPEVDVSAAHGADEGDPMVGAASVVAKVARDERMADIDADYPAYDGLGSGYPSDPATRDFLRAYVDDHGDVPDCARRSWATCDDVLAAAEQSGLDEF
jgi:ribonuclease HII